MCSHASEQLGPCTTTTEPVLCNKRSHCNEKPSHGDEEWPPLPKLEKALVQQQGHTKAKKKKKKKKLLN